jgi:hypothetical protein
VLSPTPAHNLPRAFPRHFRPVGRGQVKPRSSWHSPPASVARWPACSSSASSWSFDAADPPAPPTPRPACARPSTMSERLQPCARRVPQNRSRVGTPSTLSSAHRSGACGASSAWLSATPIRCSSPNGSGTVPMVLRKAERPEIGGGLRAAIAPSTRSVVSRHARASSLQVSRLALRPGPEGCAPRPRPQSSPCGGLVPLPSGGRPCQLRLAAHARTRGSAAFPPLPAPGRAAGSLETAPTRVVVDLSRIRPVNWQGSASNAGAASPDVLVGRRIAARTQHGVHVTRLLLLWLLRGASGRVNMLTRRLRPEVPVFATATAVPLQTVSNAVRLASLLMISGGERAALAVAPLAFITVSSNLGPSPINSIDTPAHCPEGHQYEQQPGRDGRGGWRRRHDLARRFGRKENMPPVGSLGTVPFGLVYIVHSASCLHNFSKLGS